MKAGPLIIVSGPSGSGKSTIIKRVLGENRFPLQLAVSATTRPSRPGEVDGVDYHFWTRREFERHLAAGEFLEHAVVHGELYGTPRAQVDGKRESGIGVLLDIDVQGAEQIRKLYPDHESIFIKAPHWDDYEKRIRARRGGEPEAKIAKRLETARRELERAGEYKHQIINDDLEVAVAELRELIARQFSRNE